MSDTTRVEVVEAKRLRNSANGNPRYRLAVRIHGTDGQQFLRTAKDAAFIGTVSWGRVAQDAGDMWTLKIGPRGTVVDMWK